LYFVDILFSYLMKIYIFNDVAFIDSSVTSICVARIANPRYRIRAIVACSFIVWHGLQIRAVVSALSSL